MFESLCDKLLNDPAQAFVPVLRIAIYAALGVLVLHFCVSLLVGLRRTEKRRFARWNLWEQLVYSVLFLAIVVLSATAFYAVLAEGALEDRWLLAHMVASGALIGSLPLFALTWALPCRFGSTCAKPQADGTSSQRFCWLSKICFWLILASSIVTAGTMLLSMLPLFGTRTLEGLLNVHRYSGLLLAVTTVCHFYSVWMARFGLA